jgi:O-antigen ligase
VCGLGAGVFIAAVATVSTVWAVLVVGGLVLVGGSLVVRNFKHYWIAVFLATIPFNVTKLLFYTPADVAELKRDWHLVVNENLVPQLYVSDLPFLVLLAIWFSEVLTRQTRVRIPREVMLIFAFVAWCLFTLRSAPAPFLGMVWAYYELKMVLVILWLVNASLSRSSLRLIVATLLATLALQSTITIVNYRWQLGADFFRKLVSMTETRLEVRQGSKRGTGADYVYETGELLRGTGSVGAGNSQAKFFVALLPLALTLAFLGSGAIERLLGLGCYLLGLGALYLTYSRGGMLMCLLGTGVLVFLHYLSGNINRKAFVSLVVAGLLAVGAAVPYLYSYLTVRPGFFQIRLDHINAGLEFATDNPIAGVGVNNFNLGVREKDTRKIFSTAPIHNHYLRLIVEIGIIGVVLHFVFLIAFMRQAYRSIFERDKFLAAVAMALLAGVISILVYWMDDIFYEVIIRTEFAVLLGLILVVRQVAIKEAGRLGQGMAASPAG